ncbi:ABC transporter substrate-binding protein [Lederbergia ruris]|uniref:ABC transporter substrate-binding protein n=1 Tax=Lederbergia ruris TaxID=217495 RepID=A0ABQ4KPN0_9BACI|nr:sugar ABC transporter substrate-binding protein [Lederbergia ruris]GIN59892.1 ABC transporter substrate-binding protein [Lederbergia ruris]
MKSKIFLLLTVFCLLLLPACSSGDKKSNGNEGSDKQVVIKVWDYLAPDAASGKEQVELIKKYEEEHPNIKFDRTYIPFADLKTKLLQGVAGNELPDIVVIDNPDHQSFIEAGVFADLTQEIEDWGQADQYFEGAMASAMMDGKYYGIPNNSNALAIYYNKDMFEEAGITELPNTWDELKEVARKLTKDDVKGFAMSGTKSEEATFQFLPYLWQTGADLDSFGSDNAKKALSFIQDLVSEGSLSQNMVNWDQTDVLVQFQTKKAAMMENGPWQIPRLKEESPDINFGVFTMPYDKQPASVLGGENWAITANAEHKKEAWDFIKWTQQPEILGPMHEIGGRLPSRRDIAADEQYNWAQDEHVKVFMEQLESAKPRAYGSKYPEISTNIQEAIQRAIAGEDVNTVMDNAAKKIEPLLP